MSRILWPCSVSNSRLIVLLSLIGSEVTRFICEIIASLMIGYHLDQIQRYRFISLVRTKLITELLVLLMSIICIVNITQGDTIPL